MYMVYTVAGVLFLMIAGFELAYRDLWLAISEVEDPELEGHPVKFNKTGAIIPVVYIKKNKTKKNFYAITIIFFFSILTD